MASGNGVSSNFAVLSVLSLWRSQLTIGSTLRLYANDYTPTPLDTWGSFTEASFTGYAAVSLVGLYPTPVAVVPGQWEMSMPSQIFNCSGGAGETVYGCAILDNSLNLWFSFPFAAPIVFAAGQSYAVSVDLNEWSASVIP